MNDASGAATVVYAAMLPHAAVLVPEVGRGRERPAVATIAAMRRVGRSMGRLAIDTVIVITPHGPTGPAPITLYGAPRLTGDFRAYGEEELVVHRDNDLELIESIRATAAVGAGTFAVDSTHALDRGVAVPLYFIQRGLGDARLLAVSAPDADDDAGVGRLVAGGGALLAACRSLGRRIAVISSGELSHRIFPGAPDGYHADGAAFDRRFGEALLDGGPSAVLTMPAALRRSAAEHAWSCMAVTAGLLSGARPAPTLLAYEAPFGVGYAVVTLLSSHIDDTAS